MMKVLVINQSVRFDPRSRTLIPLEKPENKVQLHTPVSECLLLLLTHNGEILSHSYLSEEVWIKKGSYVTPNSLYQNIAAIRRGLKAVGLNEEMLKTVPKMGFQIYASIQEEELLPVESDKEVKDTKENRESELLDETLLQLDLEKNHSAFTGIRIKVMYLVLTIIFILGCVHLYQQQGPIKDPYASYNNIGMINKCHVYSSYAGKEESARIFNAFMQRNNLNCSSDSKVYLTFNLNHRVSSLMLCDQSIKNKDVYCSSYVYLDN